MSPPKGLEWSTRIVNVHRFFVDIIAFGQIASQEMTYACREMVAYDLLMDEVHICVPEDR